MSEDKVVLFPFARDTAQAVQEKALALSKVYGERLVAKGQDEKMIALLQMSFLLGAMEMAMELMPSERRRRRPKK